MDDGPPAAFGGRPCPCAAGRSAGAGAGRCTAAAAARPAAGRDSQGLARGIRRDPGRAMGRSTGGHRRARRASAQSGGAGRAAHREEFAPGRSGDDRDPDRRRPRAAAGEPAAADGDRARIGRAAADRQPGPGRAACPPRRGGIDRARCRASRPPTRCAPRWIRWSRSIRRPRPRRFTPPPRRRCRPKHEPKPRSESHGSIMSSARTRRRNGSPRVALPEPAAIGPRKRSGSPGWRRGGWAIAPMRRRISGR